MLGSDPSKLTLLSLVTGHWPLYTIFMNDLSSKSGLDVKIDGAKLIYDQSIFEVEPKARSYEEAKEVYLEKGAKAQDLYYMYRYFEATKDLKTFEEHQAEYDITVLAPGKIGPEPIKTVGHYHGLVPGTEITYPEAYEVIEGEITYLLQSKPNADNEVDVVIVEAVAGDKVVVPPNYGHISMNRGENVAVESNVQMRDLPASADYGSFAERNGAALYYDGENWLENYNYVVRSKKTVKPKEKPGWGLTKNKPLYTAFIENPEKFKWLTEPQNYDFGDIWEEK